MTPGETGTEIVGQGAFKALDTQRKALRGAGIPAEIICPPGVNPNG